MGTIVLTGLACSVSNGAMPSTFTDEVRLDALCRGGYLPNKIPDGDATAKLEWALSSGYCPAYWRPTENDEEVELTMPPKGNGMVMVKRGDRDRIDDYIKARI